MPDSIFGEIEAPAGVANYNKSAAVGTDGIGLIVFLSNLLQIATVIAGVWVLINFILAGWTYITSSGKPDAHSEVSNKLLNSVMGLALIVGAYTIAGIIGLIFFQDATYIISPKFTGIGG